MTFLSDLSEKQQVFPAHITSSSFLISIRMFLEMLSDYQTVLYPDQSQIFVGPGLGPNCLQRLSADDKSLCLRENS